MRIAASGLVLATVASMATASGYSGVFNGLAAGQTTGELQCKNAQKAFLSCALANDYNATSYTWFDTESASCFAAAQMGLTGCRGGTALEADGDEGGFPTFAYASYAMAGGVTKAGNIKAQILIPSADLPIVQPNSNKPHQPKPAKSGLTKQNYVSSVTCKACIKLLQKVLKCALPVTVPAQTDPFQAYHAAADACLTTAADRVLFEVCDPLPGSPLVADANNQLSYLVAFSRLALGDIAEFCPSVEFSATAKGSESVKILKAPIGMESS